ncbi:MAG: hypothetical protein IPP69_17560 [Flavobacteriales bacterium]|nr:hypothetical protein [Flavobacteriales bacterium]
MNTIELKQTKSDERTPLEIFNEAETGQAFKVVVGHGEAIGMKCRVNGKVALVDLGQGVPYYEHGDTHAFC